jgi:O-methyltransferase
MNALPDRLLAASKLVEPLIIYPLLHGGRIRGAWRYADLTWLTRQVASVEGDFAEIGVYRGRAFRRLAPLARRQGKLAHAFDSFVGLDEPGALDTPEFPKGRFGVGGVEAFAARMDRYRVARSSYQLHAGYIPDCFADVPASFRLSFAVLDVDHYEPTVEALDWLWPRLNLGGLLALDDFLPEYEILATRAIKEFLRARADFDLIAFFNQQLILKKVPPDAPRGG